MLVSCFVVVFLVWVVYFVCLFVCLARDCFQELIKPFSIETHFCHEVGVGFDDFIDIRKGSKEVRRLVAGVCLLF